MSRSVLIVDDEIDLLLPLKHLFSRCGYEVHTATTGSAALDKLRNASIDIVVLDLMLPDMSGTQVCLKIRNDPATRALPILMLTARCDEIDRLLGFEVGADDYVTKPFSTREVVLRCDALLRRATRNNSDAQPTTKPKDGTLLWIDRPGHRVFVQGIEISLTPLEFKLLTTLMDRKRRVQSRSVLLRDVWDMNTSLSTRTVDTHVQRLRKKLGPAAQLIETVRGVGYRFTPKPG